MTKSWPALRRIKNVLKLEPTMKDPATPVLPAPDCREDLVSARTRYPEAGADSLTDVHFTALKGQTIGVIGGTDCTRFAHPTDSPFL